MDATEEQSERPRFYYAETDMQTKFMCRECGTWNDVLGRFAKADVGLPTILSRFTRQGSQVRILQRPPGFTPGSDDVGPVRTRRPGALASGLRGHPEDARAAGAVACADVEPLGPGVRECARVEDARDRGTEDVAPQPAAGGE